MPTLERPLTRVCIRLWKDDYDAIREMGGGTVSTNLIIRKIVNSYVVQMQALKRRNLDKVPAPAIEIDLDELDLAESETEG